MRNGTVGCAWMRERLGAFDVLAAYRARVAAVRVRNCAAAPTPDSSSPLRPLDAPIVWQRGHNPVHGDGSGIRSAVAADHGVAQSSRVCLPQEVLLVSANLASRQIDAIRWTARNRNHNAHDPTNSMPLWQPARHPHQSCAGVAPGLLLPRLPNLCTSARERCGHSRFEWWNEYCCVVAAAGLVFTRPRQAGLHVIDGCWQLSMVCRLLQHTDREHNA